MCLFACPPCNSAEKTGGDTQQELQRLELKVENTAREALLYAPSSAKTTNSPLVFVWHGHGGTSRNAARSFAIHRHWPEAIAVYPQGLNTPGRLTDPGGKKPGWQHSVGAQQDRDLKFFDALLARIKQDYRVDEKRIYSTGHSNGGAFTYLLWAERGSVFAAVAPSGAAYRGAPSLKPKPCFHIAGEKDPLVLFTWQKASMDAVRKLNGSGTEGKTSDKYLTVYSSNNGTPVVTFIHPGGHGFPSEAPNLIVKFFKDCVKTEK